MLCGIAINLETGEEIAITTDGEGTILNGMAEFVAQEEMSRYTGYWWSPDDAYVAHTRVDESTVDVIERFDIGADGVTVINQRYPRAGRPNAIVELYVTDIDTGERAQVDLGEETDIYLTRVNWLDDDTMIVQRQNRAQTQMDILSVEAETGESTLLFSETSETWVDVTSNLTIIDDGARFLWTSERDGFNHIYLYEADGKLVRQVTSGDWVVSERGRAIEAVNEETGMVYFSGYKDTPLEQHLYRVSYDNPGEPERLTALGGSWGATVNEDGSAFVGSYSDPSQPTQVALYDGDGERIRWIEENRVEGDHPYAPYLDSHILPEYGTLETEDGTTLYYEVLKPPHCTEANPCPAILNVYGGPGVQIVRRSWGGASEQLYADKGYVQFRIDNRGSANRGQAFADPLHRAMGGVEVQDQLLGVEWLKQQPYVDGERVGVTGWSYGGYMTLHLLLQAPDVFAAGISGAPVSDWSLYDTHYTERYMGTPENNPEGYESSSVFPFLDNLDTPLLIMHGMADDNVIFENSTKVFAELQEAGTPFEVMVYPGQRHGIRGEGRQNHRLHAYFSFFDRHLNPEPAE